MVTLIFEVRPETENAAPYRVLHLVQGDRLPLLQFAVVDRDGTTQDYGAGSTATWLVKTAGASVYTITGACTRLVNGWFQYELQDGDTDTPGEFDAALVIDVGGEELSTEVWTVRIRAVDIEAGTPDAAITPDPPTPSVTVTLHPEGYNAVGESLLHAAEGDTLPYWIFSLRDFYDDALTLDEDDVVVLRAWARDGSAYVIEAECALLDDGTYFYPPDGTLNAGEYFAHVAVTDTSDRTWTSEVFTLRVRDEL